MATIRTSRVRFERGPWRRGGAQFPAGWPFGFLLPATTLASSAWVTSPKDRAALGTQRLPFWLVINYTPGSLVSVDDQMLPVGNFVALALLGTSQQGPTSYQTQFFQLVDEKGQGFRFSRVGVIDANAVGASGAVGTRPFVFQRPYPMPDLLALLNRVANRVTATQTIQLCLYGVREYVL
jgi:hypothetical protein